MKHADSSKKRFPVIFCVYQSTSDDLAFWPLFNILFLSFYKGYSDASISLIFSVSLWISLALRFVSLYLIRRLRAGRLMIIGAMLFLCSALCITFGKGIAILIAGQCMYTLAFTYQEMSSAFLEGVVYPDGSKPNFVLLRDVSNISYSVLSLVACLLLSRLCSIGYAVPMYIGLAFCVSSVILVILLNRWDGSAANSSSAQVTVHFSRRMFDRFSVKCLALSALFVVIVALGVENLKLALRSDLAALYDEGVVVRIFSSILIVDRIVKCTGNLFGLFRSRKETRKPDGVTLLICVAALIPVLGLLSCRIGGIAAVAVAAVAYYAGIFVKDPFDARLSKLLLQSLDRNTMKSMVFANSVIKGGAKALVSSLITVILMRGTMRGVMLLLCFASLILAVYYFTVKNGLQRKKNNTVFTKWGEKDYVGADSLMMSAAVLLCYYNVETASPFSPAILASRVTSVEEIGKTYKRFCCSCFCEYSRSALEDAFCAGMACAVRLNRNGTEQWYPLILSDNDGMLVFSPEEQWIFLEKDVPIEQICLFTVT